MLYKSCFSFVLKQHGTEGAKGGLGQVAPDLWTPAEPLIESAAQAW